MKLTEDEQRIFRQVNESTATYKFVKYKHMKYLQSLDEEILRCKHKVEYYTARYNEYINKRKEVLHE